MSSRNYSSCPSCEPILQVICLPAKKSGASPGRRGPLGWQPKERSFAAPALVEPRRLEAGLPAGLTRVAGKWPESLSTTMAFFTEARVPATFVLTGRTTESTIKPSPQRSYPGSASRKRVDAVAQNPKRRPVAMAKRHLIFLAFAFLSLSGQAAATATTA